MQKPHIRYSSADQNRGSRVGTSDMTIKRWLLSQMETDEGMSDPRVSQAIYGLSPERCTASALIRQKARSRVNNEAENWSYWDRDPIS